MALFGEDYQEQYSIIASGFSKLLSRIAEASGEALTPEMMNTITDGIVPRILQSGELSAKISNVEGYLQSNNYKQHETGWRVNADGTAEFQDLTVRSQKVHAYMRNYSGSLRAAGDIVTYYTGFSIVPYIVGWWKLENNLDDSSGNSNTLTNYNTATFDNADFQEGAYSLDFERDNSEYASINDTASLSVTGGLTISLWIKPESKTDYQALVTKWLAGGQKSYTTYYDVDGRLRFGVSVDGTAESIIYSNVATVGIDYWQHFAFVFRPSTEMLIYKNGVPVTTNSITVPASIYNSTAKFQLGGEDGASLSKTIKLLVVAGGGGGGGGDSGSGKGAGGGGGAGGFIYNAAYTITYGLNTVTVGGPGGGGGQNSNGGTGDPSVFNDQTAAGGGYGGGGANIGANGGSGGGGAQQNSKAGGSASPAGQGNSGASGNDGGGNAGGGGGATAAGSGASGGAGTANSISGSAVTYSVGGNGGGGGSGYASMGSTYGCGGGGGNRDGGNKSGAAGKIGIVIVRYTTADFGACTGGNTVAVDGTETVHTFTSSGTFTAVAKPSFYDGKMDNVIVLNKACTADEIGRIYAGTIADSGFTPDGFTTTTTAGNNYVLGMCEEEIPADEYGNILMAGFTTLLRANGTDNIAIGDFLATSTVAGVVKKAATGDMAIAIAMEAYTADNSSGVLDAIIISPRKI